jgi:hypothetical protein
MRLTRCYRYALAPSKAQRDAILAAAVSARRGMPMETPEERALKRSKRAASISFKMDIVGRQVVKEMNSK